MVVLFSGLPQTGMPAFSMISSPRPWFADVPIFARRLLMMTPNPGDKYTRLGLLAAAFFVLQTAVAVLFAQQVAAYDEDTLDKRFLLFRQIIVGQDQERTDIVAMLNGDGYEGPRFEAYFKQIVFPHFTQVSAAVSLPGDKGNKVDKNRAPTARTDLPKMRADFRKVFFPRGAIIDDAAASKARDQLSRMVADRMYKLAVNQDQNGGPKNYHPLARFHAALFLSELQDESIGGTGRKAGPFLPAMSSLSKLAAPRLTPDVPEPVRIVAIKALTNYLRNASKNDPALPNILKYLNDNVTALWLDPNVKPSTGKLSQEGLDWIRRRTLELAVEMNKRSPDPAKPIIADLPVKLQGLLTDEGSAPEVRMAALQSLAAFEKFPAGVKPEEIAKGAGNLAVAAARRELQNILSQPIPPYTAKALKADIDRIGESLDKIASQTQATIAWRDLLDKLGLACETKWDQVQDPDGLSKAIRKAGAQLDIALSGKEKSDLEPDFVKVPKGFSGFGTGGIPTGGAGMGRPSGGRGGMSLETGR